jgi:endoglucanase
MEYPFWINDFDRVSNYRDEYPLASKIFEHPQSFWYGDNPKKPKKHMEKSIRRLLNRAHPQLPIFVIYNIPNRDVGQYSKGGAENREKYIDFIHRFAKGIGEDSPIIIYEPDALPHSTLLSEEEQEWRLSLMNESLDILTSKCNGLVYVDVGHSSWLKPQQVGDLLNKVSNEKVKGFSVNVCNYRTNDECLRWALRICRIRKKDTFVIDTSRNGCGPLDTEWCNPKGRGLGNPPSTNTEHKKCDAYLWIKIPGESDGKCNGGPKAGKFWGKQAESLVINSWLYKQPFKRKKV